MKFPRRKFLHLAVGAAALPAVSRLAWAQPYPTRPVRIIVGAAPSGTYDIMARLIGEWLSERLGQPFVIENRPGAGTTIGTEAVVKAPPDGYTLLLVGAAAVTSALLYDKLNFNLIRDIAPVAAISREPHIMVVNPSVPASTVPEFIAYAKGNLGKISMASGGMGTVAHLSGELFKMMTGVNLVHVPYRGLAPALTDLLGGQVQMTFASMASSIEYIRAGKLRALAVTTATRSEMLPDVPTVGQFVPGYEASTWSGVGAPKATPAEIVEKLNKEINAALADHNGRGEVARLPPIPIIHFPANFKSHSIRGHGRLRTLAVLSQCPRAGPRAPPGGLQSPHPAGRSRGPLFHLAEHRSVPARQQFHASHRRAGSVARGDRWLALAQDRAQGG
jgi:tripartite-type tricarboxylate transporter receptor subunit TctC